MTNVECLINDEARMSNANDPLRSIRHSSFIRHSSLDISLPRDQNDECRMPNQ